MSTFSITLNVVHTAPTGVAMLKDALKARARDTPFVVNAVRYAVAHIDTGALLVQRAQSRHITSPLLIPVDAEHAQARRLSPPTLQIVASPEDEE